MVHNGIEYGDMQLIAEAYDLMKTGLGMSCDEMAAAFTEWNKGELDSFLIEITRDILGMLRCATCRVVSQRRSLTDFCCNRSV